MDGGVKAVAEGINDSGSDLVGGTTSFCGSIFHSMREKLLSSFSPEYHSSGVNADTDLALQSRVERSIDILLRLGLLDLPRRRRTGCGG